MGSPERVADDEIVEEHVEDVVVVVGGVTSRNNHRHKRGVHHLHGSNIIR